MVKNTLIPSGSYLVKKEKLKNELVDELKKGEQSGFVQKFDRKKFIMNLQVKHRIGDI